MANLSVLYNPCPSRGSLSFSPCSALMHSELAAPLATTPSLFIVTDLGCVLSADEAVLTAVLRHVTHGAPLTPADVAALLLRMANAEPISDIASQALLWAPRGGITRSAKDYLHALGVALPEELLVQTWSAPVVVRALRTLAPALDFAAVFAALDDDALPLAGPRAFAFLQAVWRESGQPGTLLTLCGKPWHGRRRRTEGPSRLDAQLAFLRAVVASPEAAQLPFTPAAFVVSEGRWREA